MGGPTIGILLEQTLGHVSHGRNLRNSLSDCDLARVEFRDLQYEPSGPFDRVPPRSNWTVRAGLQARAALRDLQREAPLDALFVHTFVPAVLLGAVMDRVPTVVSLDATPCQMDSLATSYDHRVHSGLVESLKQRRHASVFHRAASLITWSGWAADSLVTDYGIDRDRIEVVPPGVVISQWRRGDRRTGDTDVARILFVGGDFERKGGTLLLEAVGRLNDDPEVHASGTRIELHLVTGSDVAEVGPDVHVHRSMTPNSPELIELYHRCNVFALPTRGDCSPVVFAEAAAAGLPALATDVGAIQESVIDGVTGHLVEPTVPSVTDALRRLVLDVDHRRRLGDAALDHAQRTMDAEANARRILERLLSHARPRTTRGRVVLTVSGDVPADVDEQISMGERPLADYVAISKAADAALLDRCRVRDEGSVLTRVLARVAGENAAMAHHVFSRRSEIDVVVTDGEQVGLPLALLLRVAGRGRMRHVMIGHRLSPTKKSLPIRLFGLAGCVDEVLVYATTQLYVAQRLFNRPGQRVRLIDFMVDSDFFRSNSPPNLPVGDERPLLCTAGRELRDYPTLIEAVRDLDVEVLIASASPWSRRADNARDVDLPPNVKVTALSQKELRDQFESAYAVVVPLLPTDFQAGVTTILEGMAMARPVVCTATVGQIDVVVDRENGLYVPPGDVAAMRRAIRELLADRESAAAMGRRGRQLVDSRADVRDYAARIAELVQWHLGIRTGDNDHPVEARVA